MNSDQIYGLIRTILAAIGGLAVGKGWIDSATVTTVAGALATVIVAFWSAWANKKANLVASVSAMPEVNSQQLAAAISDPALKTAAVKAAS